MAEQKKGETLTEDRLTAYKQHVAELVEENWKRHRHEGYNPSSVIGHTAGEVYVKVIVEDFHNGQPTGSRRVHTFIRRSDGAILKAKSFKAPDTAAGRERGYVCDPPSSWFVSAYGAGYLI